MGKMSKGREPRHPGLAMFEAKGVQHPGLECAKQHSLPETYKQPIAQPGNEKHGQSQALGGPKPPPPPQPPPPLERLPNPLS